jgi:hypothetical protein
MTVRRSAAQRISRHIDHISFSERCGNAITMQRTACQVMPADSSQLAMQRC